MREWQALREREREREAPEAVKRSARCCCNACKIFLIVAPPSTCCCRNYLVPQSNRRTVHSGTDSGTDMQIVVSQAQLSPPSPSFLPPNTFSTRMFCFCLTTFCALHSPNILFRFDQHTSTLNSPSPPPPHHSPLTYRFLFYNVLAQMAIKSNWQRRCESLPANCRSAHLIFCTDFHTRLGKRDSRNACHLYSTRGSAIYGRIAVRWSLYGHSMTAGLN